MTSASKSAFITGFYVAFVPLLAYCASFIQPRPIGNDIVSVSGNSFHVRRHRLTSRTLLTATVSLVGLFLLSGASWNNVTLGGIMPQFNISRISRFLIIV